MAYKYCWFWYELRNLVFCSSVVVVNIHKYTQYNIIIYKKFQLSILAILISLIVLYMNIHISEGTARFWEDSALLRDSLAYFPVSMILETWVQVDSYKNIEQKNFKNLALYNGIRKGMLQAKQDNRKRPALSWEVWAMQSSHLLSYSQHDVNRSQMLINSVSPSKQSLRCLNSSVPFVWIL